MARARGEVAIRLRPEGGADVTRAFKAVEADGVRAQTGVKTATDAAVAAADRQVRKLKEVSTQAALAARDQTALQAQVNRMTGVTGGGAARADMAARALFAADDAADRRAAALRAQVDPLGAAQARYNDELREYDQLLARQKLTQAEAIALKAKSRAALDAETAALQRNTAGLTRNQVASRLNLTRQGADVLVTAAMGMNPAMIAMQQGPQILDALATSGIKARGSLILLGGTIGVVATAIGVMGAAWNDAEGQSVKLDRAVNGLGRTSGATAAELETLAIAAAAQAEVSVRSARDQAEAYVSTGRIGAAVIGELIRVGKDYAATYGVDAEKATADLAQRMRDPAKAARDWTRELGLLDQKTIEHIESLQKQGDLTGAQTILVRELRDALAGQAAQIGSIESAWDAAARAVSNYWDALGRALFTTPDERVTKLETQLAHGRAQEARGVRLRPGYLEGLESDLWVARTRQGILRMEQERQAGEAIENQAAQDATDRANANRPRRARSGRDAEAEAERRRREALARERREEDRAALLARETAAAFQDFDALRELERQEQVRRRIRELVDDDVRALTATVTALREQAVLDAAREEIKARQLKLQEDQHQLQLYELEGNHRMAQTLRDRLARQELIVELAREHLDLATATALAESQMAETIGAREARRAEDWRLSQMDREIDLARMRGNEPLARALELNRETEDLARRIENMLGLDRGEGDSIAARQMAEAASAEAEGAARDWAQGFARSIRTSGIREALSDQFDRAADRFLERLIDGLFDIDWGAVTGGGGSGGGNWLTAAASWLFGRNANGTDWWPGGPSLVGERGPELVNLPRGAQVIDADRTRRMMLGGGATATRQVNHYHFTGNLMTPEFWDEIHRRDRRAAAAGAGQGAATAVGIVHSSAGQVQHEERMLKA